LALLGEACGDAAPQDLSGEGDGRFPFMRGADGADAPKLVDAQMVGFIAESGSEGVACALEPGNFALRGPSSAGQSIGKGAPEGTRRVGRFHSSRGAARSFSSRGRSAVGVSEEPFAKSKDL